MPILYVVAVAIAVHLGLGLLTLSHGLPTISMSRSAEELGGKFEGDMMFSPSDIQSSGLVNPNSLWPDGRVIFKLDDKFTGVEKKIILNAMREITVKTCVEFQERLDNEVGFVEIIRGPNGTGCWAEVGYTGRGQALYLSNEGCIYHGMVLHELLHTLGFYHEQSRTDRDDYIKINDDNIHPSQRSNFNKYNSTFITDYNLPYDYSSIMHYGDKFFAQNPELRTIIVKDPFATIGHRRSLSELDVERIQRRYNTSEFKCRCSAPTFCTKDRLIPERDLIKLFKLYDSHFDRDRWIIIQKRSSGPKSEFHRGWADYERGFGSVDGNFWIGLKTIHDLTKDQDVELRIDLWDFEGHHAYALYSNFSIADSSDDYRLSIGGYSGTAGDSITEKYGNEGKWNLNGMKFSTKDRDNDRQSDFNCAEKYRSAWWFNSCYSSNLNGLYLDRTDPSEEGMSWYYWKQSWSSLKKVEMKIRKRL